MAFLPNFKRFDCQLERANGTETELRASINLVNVNLEGKVPFEH